mmetsp:Transcript_57909/g.172192  ORF Transcript_57909/g.172192 Transcript_57909/m.172192 type:complete len:268 (+) Transcript_57909:57-860(+)
MEAAVEASTKPWAAWAASHSTVVAAIVTVSVLLAVAVVLWAIALRRQARELDMLKKSWEEVAEMSAGELELRLKEGERALEEAEERSRTAEAEVRRLRDCGKTVPTKTVWKCKGVASAIAPSEDTHNRAPSPREDTALAPAALEDGDLDGSEPGLMLEGQHIDAGRRPTTYGVPTAAHLAKRYKGGRQQAGGLGAIDGGEDEFGVACGYRQVDMVSSSRSAVGAPPRRTQFESEAPYDDEDDDDADVLTTLSVPPRLQAPTLSPGVI